MIRRERPNIYVIRHPATDFDSWFELFTANPPPDIGKWRLIRGIDDPNRVRVVAEMSASEVEGVEEFMESERMQKIFRQVSEMSTSPLEFVWFEDVTPS